jgi:hypothetical protein
MARVRPLEVRALTPLLEQDWETPEQLAEALILALDGVRGDRTSYVGIMQFGSKDGAVWYAGIGPYPGQKSAVSALRRHPGASLAHRCAVVPILSPEGFVALLKDVA